MPTLCVGTHVRDALRPVTLRPVNPRHGTQSVPATGSHAERGNQESRQEPLVPTLCVGTHVRDALRPVTLRPVNPRHGTQSVPATGSHAERGNQEPLRLLREADPPRTGRLDAAGRLWQ